MLVQIFVTAFATAAMILMGWQYLNEYLDGVFVRHGFAGFLYCLFQSVLLALIIAVTIVQWLILFGVE